MKEWIKAQGGNEEVVDHPSDVLNISKEIIDFKADRAGYITYIDTEKVGMASMYLGAGRQKKDDSIDLSVGLKILKKSWETKYKTEKLSQGCLFLKIVMWNLH